jgi:hypothetical protein
MKQLVLTAVLIGAIIFCERASVAQDTKPAKPLVALGTVVITKDVMLAGGKQIGPGTYDVRLTREESRPSTGLIPGLDRQVEFVRRSFYRRSRVAGTAVVNVVAAADIGKIRDQEGGAPRRGAQKVDTTPHDFLRIWFNKGETHYLIYLRSPAG